MDEKLQKLLETINLDTDMYDNFNGGKLEKIVVSKKKDSASFHITLNSPLTIDLYIVFKEKIEAHFDMPSNLNIKTSNFGDDILSEYYKMYLSTLMEGSNSAYLNIFNDAKITLEDSIMTIELGNKAEETKFKTIKDKLFSLLVSSGFSLSNIKTKINKEKSKEVAEQIEEEKRKSQEIVEKIGQSKQAVLYGSDFEANPITLNEITSSSDSVDIEVTIVNTDLKASSAGTTHILSLAVMDPTGKKSCKMFVKEKERAEKIISEITLNNWYKIRGKAKSDNFSRGLSIMVDSMVEIEKPERVFKIEEEHKKIIKGRKFEAPKVPLKDLTYEAENISIEAKVFAIDLMDRPKIKLVTLKVTDEIDSLYCKIFEYDEDQFNLTSSKIKKGKWYSIRGNVKYDEYSKELVMSVNDMFEIDKKEDKITDDAEEKRIELHAHTKMSQMDGLADEFALVDQAIAWGHKGIAITDHNGCQAFPHVFSAVTKHNKKIEKEEDKFKVLYGTEIAMVEDHLPIITRGNDSLIRENTFVIFDVETTGLNAGLGDTIIELGAVKVRDGEVIDRFNELSDPGVPLSRKIIEITQITDAMVKGKPSEEEVVKRFKEWIEDCPLIAHNAKFDSSMLEMAYYKYNLGELTNPLIDTLEISRTLEREHHRHSLSALVKRYGVPFDEAHHHRADYDAEATAYVFNKMIMKMEEKGITTLSEINNLCGIDETYIYARDSHINILALNKTGLKNLFKIISYANTNYMSKYPKIPRMIIEQHREGLLIGSGCYRGEIFTSSCMDTDSKLEKKLSFYDYVEVQPLEVYEHLVLSSEITTLDQIEFGIKRIISTANKCGKIPVATGDVHHIKRDDKLYREIIVNQKVPGGGRHPLARVLDAQGRIPSQHLRTTNEMLKDFQFLDDKLRKEIVIDNPKKILDMAEIIEVIIQTGGIPFSPKMENSQQITKDLVYDTAHSLYGNPLPELINTRIEQELNGIIKGGFDVIYLIAQKLVKKSNDDGYLVGSRGSVGSSFVATLMGISEVNPLPAHYRCPKCKHSIFEKDGKVLGADYSSGFDLPDLDCPNCNAKMSKDGQDMPFATFLGFEADKVPDIDLNFSGEYQAKAHEYTKELFGPDNVYRAGTVGTVAEKTAYGFVKGFFEDRGIQKRGAEIERLLLGCTGVKRTTGQHPGGIIVVPDYMDIFDFCPFQFPADDANAKWRTSHFEYHALEEDLLKLDILGHDDPTVLRMLHDLSGIDIADIPLDDQKTMGIFSSPEPLGVTKEDIMCETGTLGVPEFGTKFVIGMLVDTRPKTFAELVKISGLSHGTDVWLGNAQDLVRGNVVPFKDVIGCRDDIMVYLSYQGMQPKKAFKIMEFVRKGKPSKEKEAWKEFDKEMQEANIEEWFRESCRKIKYMFPKSHAAAYVTSAFRIAWFKVHHPLYYYAAYLSIRCSDFDIEAMIKGRNAIRNKIVDINAKGYDVTNKETSVLEVLEVALEATARGFSFANIDINKSDATKFTIVDEMTLLPPFRTIDGLGDTVAQNIVEEREKAPFLSIEDLQKRAKVSTTLIEKMRMMGMLDGLDESSQLSLF